MIKISDLKPLENNPRKIADQALEKLQESISRDPEYMESDGVKWSEATHA